MSKKDGENPAGFGNTFDVPLELRANDITRHVINIDSRFRSNPTMSNPSNFYYRLHAPVKNILRIRVTSVEFPSKYTFFTAQRMNVVLRIIYNKPAPQTYVITIPDGNYTPEEMTITINGILAANIPWLSLSFNAADQSFTFAGDQYFAIDSTYESFYRMTDYGLGYYLGFSRKCHLASPSATDPTVWEVSSTFCADLTGDYYVFLKVNDFESVSHQTEDQTFTALAKIILHGPNHHGYDDHTKEVVFPNPQDLTKFHIQILDAYGNLIDLCGKHFSFSLEVLEVKNLTLYNTIRDSLSLRYV